MTRDLSLLEGMATTRAIRRYTPDPIPDADLAEILWYAGRAPSGTNRQKFFFITLRRHDRSALLPCTPLAVLKLLDAAGASRPGSPRPLAGVRACVFNRSEVVGRPLASMMANDGAEVVSSLPKELRVVG